ncbi:MarR family transcriptional regulator [Hydrogenispora ethanolica]|jgi:DNA-binding MarR family transcriptional regulator|uniref:MarR family transcriptional regulator n=1 Tax=Hydrogenispora ethanolica TaxID=1082276 RepID=A0A4R1R1L0_HYDET|nr:MarR family transcriptional regulator [Hydrogenispora ethanolica]TCL59233.1 MarR family transcriptional regulator [Hydrogenispora ethanolica]
MDPLDRQSLSHALRQFINIHRQRTHALLGKLGLYPGQSPLLFMLWERDGRTQKEFAERLQVAPATITVMLQRMERTGLLERRPDPGDLRVSRVYLTEAGRRIRVEVEAVHKQLNDQCFAGFTLEERVLLRRFLLQMHDNLARPEAE